MPQITKESLQKNLANIQAQREHHLQQATRCDGAIETLKALLARINTPESQSPDQKQ